MATSDARKKVRENIKQRAQRIQEEREAGRGLLAQLRAAFSRLDDEVAERMDEAEEDRKQRLERDRFAFASEREFQRYRKRRGLPPAPPPPRDIEAEPWAGLSRHRPGDIR